MRIVLYGATSIARLLGDSVREGVDVVAYAVDPGYEDKVSKDLGNVPLITTDQLQTIQWDYIVIAFSNTDAGLRKLEERGVPRKKIVAFSYGWFNYSSDDNKYQKLINDFWQEEINYPAFRKLFSIEPPHLYICGLNNPKLSGDESEVVEQDYVREKTLQLIAAEIKRKHVEGNVAEVGVYKGDFSKKINRLFPDRKLYLFDTFEGFDNRDMNITKDGGEVNMKSFQDSDVQLVLSKMKYPERCVVKKGYFPDSFDLENEMFAFVSLDLDLYSPTLSGLELFYPRLSKGGYIMVHDYNGLEYDGAMNAVIEYCDKRGIGYVPIPDTAGSVIITK